jgi:hypothetical protein
MKKLIHYILIGIMLNWNVTVFAETDQGCANWEVVEETDKYIQETCADIGKMQARIRSKPVEGMNIIVVELLRLMQFYSHQFFLFLHFFEK